MEGFFFPMVQLMDGEARVIWPLEYAKAEFQAPPWLKAWLPARGTAMPRPGAVAAWRTRRGRPA